MKKFNTVAELLKNPTRWCQDKLRDCDEDGNVTACCIEGAIITVYQDNWNAIKDACTKIRAIIGMHRIFDWNDDPKRTHSEVLEVVTKANI